MESSKDDFGDLCYDVWRSGGNPDCVDRDRFAIDYNGEYDWISDADILATELKLQRRREG